MNSHKKFIYSVSMMLIVVEAVGSLSAGGTKGIINSLEQDNNGSIVTQASTPQKDRSSSNKSTQQQSTQKTYLLDARMISFISPQGTVILSLIDGLGSERLASVLPDGSLGQEDISVPLVQTIAQNTQPTIHSTIHSTDQTNSLPGDDQVMNTLPKILTTVGLLSAISAGIIVNARTALANHIPPEAPLPTATAYPTQFPYPTPTPWIVFETATPLPSTPTLIPTATSILPTLTQTPDATATHLAEPTQTALPTLTPRPTLTSLPTLVPAAGPTVVIIPFGS